MNDENDSVGGVLYLILGVLGSIGFVNYFVMCWQAAAYGWFIAGIVFPPAAIVVGTWGLFFGLPGWMT